MCIRQLLLPLLGVVVLAGVMHAEPQEANKEKKNDTSDLAEQWWQLAHSLPAEVSPFLDDTKCGVGQAGPVWFLYSTALVQDAIGEPTDARCTIPAEKSIFLGITTAVCIRDSNQRRRDIVAECAQGLDAPKELRLVIDGLDYSKLIDRRTSRRPFTLPVPEGNVVGWPGAGVFSAVYDGYFALLPPLKPGDHTILVQAAIVLDNGMPIAFSTRHLLHIVERARIMPELDALPE